MFVQITLSMTSFELIRMRDKCQNHYPQIFGRQSELIAG